MPTPGTITADGPERIIALPGLLPTRATPRSEPRPAGRFSTGPTRAETLECACPDFCERDHEQD